MFSLLDVLILMLATWRTAHLLTSEDAPFRLMARIRERTTLGGLLTCIKCASVWTAALLLWFYSAFIQPLSLAEFMLLIPAVSGGALMLASYTGVNRG